jgi:hypothetical protein
MVRLAVLATHLGKATESVQLLVDVFDLAPSALKLVLGLIQLIGIPSGVSRRRPEYSRCTTLLQSIFHLGNLVVEFLR